MAWEWSHTVEAYQDARDNLFALPEEVLAELADEWGIIGEIVRLGREAVAEVIWERVEAQRLCDNGGHRAWACPHGCHTVPFHREENL